jgi:hypothetical protein
MTKDILSIKYGGFAQVYGYRLFLNGEEFFDYSSWEGDIEPDFYRGLDKLVKDHDFDFIQRVLNAEVEVFAERLEKSFTQLVLKGLRERVGKVAKNLDQYKDHLEEVLYEKT